MKTVLRSIIFSAIAIVTACRPVPEEGVSYGLATERAALLSDVCYRLGFDLSGNSNICSHDTISFVAAERNDIILDFKAPAENIRRIEVNGKNTDAAIINEHIVIPKRLVRKGSNSIIIDFIAGEQSINRREDFMYTLLVPDRARTLFPCFEQPDIKAEFNLTLNVPKDWVAVSNTGILRKEEFEASTLYTFSPTRPLSTYLFSFVAGRFERLESSRGGRTIAMYHRETDPEKIAQSDDIFKLVFDSLDWLEDYTGIPYPFDKYDFIVIPDFQYGGMEHTGATLYNDRRIFLSKQPTTAELLNRASLIAHETSHMWFGDYVTMKWFDDVWTKEVFANWFATQIMRPLFPEVNHALSDLRDLYAPAYTEDRTRGSNAIRRPLANLQDAGLIYCNIIYDKAPVVMDKLAIMLGEKPFREGMREYLKEYGYANATWDDLVEILDSRTDVDLKEWSEVWIKEAGMPAYCGKVTDGELTVEQQDPLGMELSSQKVAAGLQQNRREAQSGRAERQIVWQQELKDTVAEGKYWIPNIDGRGYGWFSPDDASMEYIQARWSSFDEAERMSLLMTLYENSRRGTLDRMCFIEWCSRQMMSESNPLILSSLMGYASSEVQRCGADCPEFTASLRAIAADNSRNHEYRLMAFRQLFNAPCTPEQMEELYGIWKDQKAFTGLDVKVSGSGGNGLELGERDYTDLACQLMIAFPDRAAEIADIQMERITNPDRKASFGMLCRAASPDKEVRSSLFKSFMDSPENRRPESRVLSALALLCHRSRAEEAREYIIPSLDALKEIQRTGDIFFPGSWCRVLLENQKNDEARSLVDGWLAAHPDINPLLATKILQAAD